MNLSKSAKRKRRKNQLYRALMDLFGHDEGAVHIPAILYEAGITTPEELLRATYKDLEQVPGLGKKSRQRVIQVRHTLQLAQQEKGGES